MGVLKWLGVVIALAAILSNLLLFKLFNNGKDSCPIREKAGVYCPGCGGTRSLKSLVNGDFTAAFDYHFLFVSLFLTGVFYLVLSLLQKRFIPVKSAYAWTGLVLGIMFVLLRNMDNALGRYLAP